ncbi:MAG: chorismate synthase [Deltaproteobacteria bacterium]|nr:chorismate synthase [Deltaproteobacteria bacterium]
MLTYLTAGESHGPQLTAIISGLPAGVPVAAAEINRELARRQQGYGRGQRMQIETDQVELLAGVRFGETTGNPLTLVIRNRDWENWRQQLSTAAADREAGREVTRPRPGHADLPGCLKFNHRDARNILERASARETAIRVATGAICKAFLAQFEIEVFSYVTAIGGLEVATATLAAVDDRELARTAEKSPFRVPDPGLEEELRRLVDQRQTAGDTLGGTFRVVARGLPPGIGSHIQADTRLDGRLAAALMSIQAIKGVEIGLGFRLAALPGSQAHDEIFYDRQRGFYHRTNRAGGLEGGISNGEDIVVGAAMKPIPTLYQPLRSVDLHSKEPFQASVERSDICAVPAAAVVGEAAVAIELSRALLEKFAGDHLEETKRNFAAYCRQVRSY